MQVEIAVPTPLSRTFTYLADQPVAAGTRVLVPFGRRRLVGVALGPAKAVADAADAGFELKKIERIIDESPVYSSTVLEVARWISSYYMHPLGEVLRTMLPASTTKVVKETCALTEAGAAERQAASTPAGRLLAQLFGKKKTEIGTVTLRTKLKRLTAKGDADAASLGLRQLKKLGLITPTRGTSVRARASGSEDEPLSVEHSVEQGAAAAGEPAVPDRAPDLTPTQQHVVAEIVQQGLTASASKVFLLHGVTGSGKTEVYLRLIAEAIRLASGDAQALVLVPEISLTPQMTRVFERRFPAEVAVVHSAMTDTDRWAQLARIRAGEAKILIGPRSAVFGPFRNLRLILVDEEHDSSYKQSTGLTYNGRDVAVLRGRLEAATVVLGSATPSMETFNNALTGRYVYLQMPERVSGRPLPEIEVITNERPGRNGTLLAGPDRDRRGGEAGGGPAGQRGAADAPASGDNDAEIPIDPRVLAALRDNHAAGRQAIVLVNRRGYAYYLFSLDEKKAVQCPHCSISMTLHARSTVLRCHYCDYQTTVSKVVEGKPDDTFLAVGYGSQKAEDCLKKQLPGARIVRLDSDSVAQRDVLPRILGQFRQGEIDILVGTQILAKGHDFPNVTLIVILEVDQLLGLPDFRAGERTFQLVVQAAGRAGRAELAGKVLIQTMRASHPVVTAAIAQDYKAFAERELKFRQQLAYPPFARMIAFELNSPDKARLAQLCRRIEGWVEQMALMKPQLVQKVRVLGPSVPPIETIRSRHRRSLIFSSDQVEPLRQLAHHFCAAFQKLPADVRLRIDVDPQSLT